MKTDVDECVCEKVDLNGKEGRVRVCAGNLSLFVDQNKNKYVSLSKLNQSTSAKGNLMGPDQPTNERTLDFLF